jgi:hypothetical protein
MDDAHSTAEPTMPQAIAGHIKMLERMAGKPTTLES